MMCDADPVSTVCSWVCATHPTHMGWMHLREHQSHKKEQDLLNSTYQLLFDEDGGDVKSVNVTLVVERPRV